MHFRFCEGSHLPVIGHANATQARRLFNVTHQGAASDRGRSLMYARMPCCVFGQVGMQQLSEKMPHIIRRAEVSQSLSRVCLSQELRSRHGFRQWTHAMYLDKIGALASAIKNNPVNRSGAIWDGTCSMYRFRCPALDAAAGDSPPRVDSRRECGRARLEWKRRRVCRQGSRASFVLV